MSTYRIKVSIAGTKPLVWRRIRVPDRITFHQLHLVLQECFQWKDYHLYQFDVPGLGMVSRSWEDDCWDDEDESIDSLEKLIDPYMEPGTRITYVYDFGDWWEHVIDVEAVIKKDCCRMPIITAWRGKSLIEDAGGVSGYEETMRIIKDKDDPEYRMTREWVRNFSPPKFDREYINGYMAERLYFPKAAFSDLGIQISQGPENVVVSKPAVSLKEAVDFLDMQTMDDFAYVNLDTGECHILFTDAGVVDQDVIDEGEKIFKSCNSLILLGPDELEDYRAMRDFALSQEGVAGDRLSEAIEGRGAFKRFKNTAYQLGLMEEWYAYRDEYRAELLKNYFEVHNVKWK